MAYVNRNRATRPPNKAQGIAILVGALLFVGDLCLPWRGPPDTYRYAASGRRMAPWSKPALVALPLSLTAVLLGTAGALYGLRSVIRLASSAIRSRGTSRLISRPIISPAA